MRDQAAETTDHLLLNCVYSRELWFRLLSSVGLQHWVPQGQETLAEWWGQQRASAPSSAQNLRLGPHAGGMFPVEGAESSRFRGGSSVAAPSLPAGH